MNKDTVNSLEELGNLVKQGFKDWRSIGHVTAKETDDLILFNYTTEAQIERRWNWFERHSRGLVLEKSTGKIIARPFPKFFNWGEKTTNANIVQVWEKMDGSLGICYYYNGWRVNTRGSFSGKQSEWATKWINSHPNLDMLDKNNTYLFEIIYPENRIVIDYKDRAECVLLAVINTETGAESPIEDYAKIFSIPKSYSMGKPEELLELCQKLDENNEGFVAEFSNGERFKFKGEKYLELHRLIFSLSFKNTVQVIQSGTLDSARGRIPDEFLAEFNDWVEQIEQRVKEVKADIEYYYPLAPKGTRKELALYAMEHCPHLLHYFFAILDNKFDDKMIYKIEFK